MLQKCLRYLLAAVTVAVLAFSVNSTDAAQKKIAFLSPESVEIKDGKVIGDYGWNQMGAESALQACKNTGSECEIASGLGYADIRPVLREFATSGFDLIIAHASGYNSAAAEIAKEFNVPVVITELPGSTTPGLINDYELSGASGAYLAGVLAAKTTRAGILGIVVTSEIVTWNLQAGGFVQGALSVNPDINIHYAVIGHGAYEDVAGANRVTKSVIGAGADVIYGMGNGATFGMLQAVETTPAVDGGKVWFIDIIGDKRGLDKGYLLSSTAWDLSSIWTAMINDLDEGTFGTKSYDLNLGNDTIKLLRTEHISDVVWAEIVQVRDDIVNGSIEVAQVREIDKLKAMMSRTTGPSE
jgi:simple sugar transport system substrate-binding protein